MTLNRWPDNFFAETEQVAFHPGHLVPGIEFSNDPLLQGRIFSYTDTQLKRLGGPNFHELEINRPKCPMHNFQRDGMARMAVDQGRTNYEPNSLEPTGPRESPRGFSSFEEPMNGAKVRRRSETFADYYSQARMFYRSQTPVEQGHVASALTFELAKVEAIKIRTRVLGHLELIDQDLAARVAEGLGMSGQADRIQPVVPVRDLPPSPALSILAKAPATLEGRKVGVLISDGFDATLLARLRSAAAKQGAMFEVVAPKVGATRASDGSEHAADHMVSGGPSILFDTVALVLGADSAEALTDLPAAIDWVSDAYNHCKVIGVTGAASPLLDAARAKADEGVIDLAGKGFNRFFETAKNGRIWSREKNG